MESKDEIVCVVVTPDREGHYDIDAVSLDSEEGVVVASDAKYDLPNLMHLCIIPSHQWRTALIAYMDHRINA